MTELNRLTFSAKFNTYTYKIWKKVTMKESVELSTSSGL